MTFAEWIRAQRKSRNWTQGELAEKLGMHVKAVTTWEMGKGKPNRNTLKRLAVLLDYLPDVLVQAAMSKKGKLPPVDRQQGELTLDPMLAARLRRLANHSGMNEFDWLDRMIASMEAQALAMRELMPDIAGRIGGTVHRNAAKSVDK